MVEICNEQRKDFIGRRFLRTVLSMNDDDFASDLDTIKLFSKSRLHA